MLCNIELPGEEMYRGVEGGSTVQCSGVVQYSTVQFTRVFASGSVSSLWAGSQSSRVDTRQETVSSVTVSQCYTVLYSEIDKRNTISPN